jgi:thymidylate synthase (FAD)
MEYKFNHLITVELIDHMGSDLSVVNAARVSFNKQSDWDSDDKSRSKTKTLRNKDERLIEYLAQHNHWSPFSHATMSVRIVAPIFVARQLAKHQVGLAWNEISRRYVTYDPDIWLPETWRKQDENLKQGSMDEEITSPTLAVHTYQDAARHAVDAYNNLIKLGVCAEQARAVLTQGVFTEWYWTGSLYAFSRVYNLRMEETAQRETGEVAKGIGFHANRLFPISWNTLTGEAANG